MIKRGYLSNYIANEKMCVEWDNNLKNYVPIFVKYLPILENYPITIEVLSLDIFNDIFIFSLLLYSCMNRFTYCGD